MTKSIKVSISTFSIQIIEFTAKDRFTLEYIFRGYYFATVKVFLTYQGKLYKYYFDIEYIISLIDRAFLD